MWVGRYVDGRDLTYDETEHAFAIGGTPVSLRQIAEYDAFAQIAWLSPEMRAWAQDLIGLYQAGPSPTQTVGQAPASRPGWFARLPLWGKAIFILFYPASIPYGIWAMWKTQRYSHGARVALSVGGVLLFLVLFAFGTPSSSSTPPPTEAPSSIAALPPPSTATSATLSAQATPTASAVPAAPAPAVVRAPKKAASAKKAKPKKPKPKKKSSPIVYITDTGHKYHRAGCRYLKYSSNAVTLSQAKALGCTACKICGPPG